MLTFFLDVFNRCFMCSLSTLAISCPEHARLESEFQEARDRLRSFLTASHDVVDFRQRQFSRQQERRLADEMAMAIARLKEHMAAHGCKRP
jgi:hypothetical protein